MTLLELANKYHMRLLPRDNCARIRLDPERTTGEVIEFFEWDSSNFCILVPVKLSLQRALKKLGCEMTQDGIDEIILRFANDAALIEQVMHVVNTAVLRISAATRNASDGAEG